MIRTILKCVILMTAVFFFSNCATIVTRSTYPLTINSTPSNARVSIINSRGLEIYAGTTPTVVGLKAGDGFFRRAEYQVRISKPGYDTQVIPVTFSLDGWYFGNLLIGGFLGMLIIDPATGAMWRIDIDFINVALNPLRTSNTPELRIMDINEIPESWKSKLIALD